MVVHVRAEGHSFKIPAPLWMLRTVLALTPEGVLWGGWENGDTPVDKEAVREMLEAVSDMAGEYKGLEVVRVEQADGTFVSIVL